MDQACSILQGQWGALGGLGALLQALLGTVALAGLLTKTSTSLVGNLPLALLAVVTVRFLLAALERQLRAQAARTARAPPMAWRREAPPTTPAPTLGIPPGSSKPDAWRKFVRAPVVEEAWARFAGSIVQEFLYDTWYACLTPDREFPAEVRRILNTAFGQLALRARQLDLRAVMNDLCELAMEQLELYRDTRDSITLATQNPDCLRDMSPAARDRALQREMRAEGNLHPALQTPDGHYKYLKAVSEGVVAYLLDMSDLQRPAARCVCRELLAAAVLRPLMMYCTPYYANKALYTALRERQAQKRTPRQAEEDEVSAELASARSEAMRGHFLFEQRLLHSVVEEDSALSAARQLRHQLRSKLSQHARSKSVDNLGLAAEQARELPAAAGPVREQEQAHAHLRARSCSPAELGQGAERSPGQATATAAVALAGDGSGQRGRLASSSGQLRPPRPPLSQQSATQPESQGERGQQQTSGQAAPRTSPQQLHGQEAQQQRQQQERSPFDVFNVASAVAAVLMPKQPSQQQQQQQQTTTTGPTPRHQGASDEAAEGEAWESVDVSDASVALTQRDFSFAHLIAPLANQAGLSSVTPRTTSSSSASGRGHATFVGRAFAKVVAADLNTSGTKDYVEFKIRVADDSGEWTVSRRYRQFESLHRQLRCYPCYRLKLPPKRIFVHSNSVEFVEERRFALDKYLQELLAHGELSQSPDLYEFLRLGSQLYELTSPQQPTPRASTSGMLGGLGKAATRNAQTMGRGLASATGTVAGAVAGTVKQGVSELASAASGSVARVTGGVAGATGAVRATLSEQPDAEAHPQPGLARRVQSVPSGLHRTGNATASASAAGGEAAEPAKRGSSASALSRPDKETGGGLLSKASTRLRQAIQRDSSAQVAHEQLEPSGHSSSSSSATAIAEQGSDQLSSSPGKRRSRLFNSLRRRSRSQSVSPTKEQRDKSPSRKPRRGGSSSRRSSVDLDANGLAGGTDEVPPHLASSLNAHSPAPSSPIFSFPVDPSLELEDSAGISAPLYEIVDCLFQLQTHGFIRRQVFGMARQALSLVAGEAIDAYLTSRLRLLRQQHTIGRIIQQIQASLWPGGVWFQHTPAAQARAAAGAASQQSQPPSAAAGSSSSGGADSSNGSSSSSGASPGYARPEGMDPEKFLTPGGPAPLDEDEIREAVEQLLLRRAPAAVVRLVGKSAYASGMRDLFGMLQSPAFCCQLGYGCLEIAIVHLFPELKSLFRTLQHGGLV